MKQGMRAAGWILALAGLFAAPLGAAAQDDTPRADGPQGHGEQPRDHGAQPGQGSGEGDRHGHGHGDHDGPTVHRRFDDARQAERMFEDPKRDAWQMPEKVLEVLGLKPTDKVADIGSATGYFPVRFARVVTEGVVYGVDIEPALVNHLNLRARRERLFNLVSLVCKLDDPCLPEPVDVVFVCDTYHHIGDRAAYFARVRERYLRPGGRLVIVDFRLGKFPVGPDDSKKLPAARVEEELKGAGYRLARHELLPYQYMLVFERAE